MTTKKAQKTEPRQKALPPCSPDFEDWQQQALHAQEQWGRVESAREKDQADYKRAREAAQAKDDAQAAVIAELKVQLNDALLANSRMQGYLDRSLEDDAVRELGAGLNMSPPHPESSRRTGHSAPRPSRRESIRDFDTTRYAAVEARKQWFQL